MPQHVHMYRERQPSGLARPLNHACNAHPAEGMAPFIDEGVGAPDPVSLLLPVQELETIHLIALQVMNAIRAALEPPDDCMPGDAKSKDAPGPDPTGHPFGPGS
jgi:hypothetical protein